MSPSSRSKSSLERDREGTDIPSLEAVSSAATLSAEDLDQAIKPLREYLKLQPNNYSALEKVRSPSAKPYLWNV